MRTVNMSRREVVSALVGALPLKDIANGEQVTVTGVILDDDKKTTTVKTTAGVYGTNSQTVYRVFDFLFEDMQAAGEKCSMPMVFDKQKGNNGREFTTATFVE